MHMNKDFHPGIFSYQEWKDGQGTLFSSHNPATGKILWQGKAANQTQVNEAVLSARKAFPAWSNLTIDERTLFLNNFEKILKQESTSLSEIISQETGKPLWDSKNEVNAMINKIEISLSAYGSRCAGMIHTIQPAIRNITRHKPHGIIAVISPFNFPGHLANAHIIPALLAGNTVVLKPSELTPLVAEKMIQCWEQSNLPKGVINLVQGGSETGKALVENSDINGVFFTGSYNTGKWLIEKIGSQPQKILALEMGGNNPLIIGNTEKIKIAAYLTIQSTYLTSGQRCTCARRLILIKGNRDEEFMQTLQELIDTIIVGSYDSNPEPYMGPVITESHALNFIKAQAQLVAAGGKILNEMRHLVVGTGFLSPGLIDVTNVVDRPDEEIFGPFLQIIRVDNLEEALKEANNTKFGLSAGIFTDEHEEYDFFYRNIRAGIINWNTQLTGASSSAPFGGIGWSGNFRPSAYYAADYCSYPVASTETTDFKNPLNLPPGLKPF